MSAGGVDDVLWWLDLDIDYIVNRSSFFGKRGLPWIWREGRGGGERRARWLALGAVGLVLLLLRCSGKLNYEIRWEFAVSCVVKDGGIKVPGVEKCCRCFERRNY